MYFTTIAIAIGLLGASATATPIEARSARSVLIFGGGTPEAFYTVEPPHGVEFAISKSLVRLLQLGAKLRKHSRSPGTVGFSNHAVWRRAMHHKGRRWQRDDG